MNLSKAFALIAVFYLLTPPAQANTAELDRLIKTPTRRMATAVLAQGAGALADYDREFAASKNATLRLFLLRIIIALPGSAERTQILARISGAADSSDTEKLMAAHADAFFKPTDTAAQDAFLKDWDKLGNQVDYRDFDWAFYGNSGLTFLESILLRPETWEKDFAPVTAQMLVRDFPQDADDILEAMVSNATADLFTLESTKARDRLYAFETILKMIERDQWKLDKLRELTADEKLAALDDKGANREVYISFLVSSLRNRPDVKVMGSVFAFYLNAETSPKDKTETDEHFGRRRTRLLNLLVLVRKLQFQGDPLKSMIEDTLEDYPVEIFTSDMEEFRVGMLAGLPLMKRPQNLVKPLLMSANATQISSALQMMRQVPASHWAKVADSEVYFNRVSSLSQYGFPAHPESVRLEAAATLIHLQERGSDSLQSILSGLNSADKTVRLKVISLLDQGEWDSDGLAESLGRLIGRDPDKEVRVAALKLVESRLRTAEDQRRPSAFANSAAVGKALLSQWKSKDKDILAAAEPCFPLYVALSPYAQQVLSEGLGSGDAAVAKTARTQLLAVINKQAGELYRNLERYSSQELSEDNAPSLGAAVHLTGLVRQLVTGKYASDKADNLERVYRMTELLQQSEELIAELVKIRDDKSPEGKEAKEQAEKALDKITDLISGAAKE